MRVHELAKELGVTSAEVIGAAREVQVPVDHASNALTDDEAERLRAALSGADAPGADAAGADAAGRAREAAGDGAGCAGTGAADDGGGGAADDGEEEGAVRAFRLVGKRSVTCRGVKVERGGRAEGAWVAALPARLRTCFEEV